MRIQFALMLACLVSCFAAASEKLPGDIKLLDGYIVTRQARVVDARALIIEKTGGAKIEFESGPNEGSWAEPANSGQYAWYREQTINGCKVRIALIKRGLKTVWETSGNEAGEFGNILLVTFLINGEDSSYTANFKAKIRRQSDIGDALLMAVTFDPSKGGY